ncbi:MAG: response regulator, partial [Rubricoccaceae bacterium]|nr:response regulator [Rubricoccaceae bacterium]
MRDKIQVLVVDDEPLARQRLVDLISRSDSLDLLGVATNGHEGVESIQNLDPDLVFLDVQMPG